jgi:hypothetical protein
VNISSLFRAVSEKSHKISCHCVLKVGLQKPASEVGRYD